MSAAFLRTLARHERSTFARSKYSAQAQTVDGVRFDSKREAHRYAELKMLERAHRVQRLMLHPVFPLFAGAYATVVGDLWHPFNGGTPTSAPPMVHAVAAYVADFLFDERSDGAGAWVPVVEDAKGVRTPVYRLKRRWFEAQYGVRIREV